LNTHRPHVRRVRTLDIGCGTLKGSKRYGGIGIDLHKGYCDIVADAHHLPFVDDAFSKVYARAVLEHLDKPFLALNEIKRVLSENGVVSISIPVYHNPPIDELLNFILGFPMRSFATVKRLTSMHKYKNVRGLWHKNRIRPEHIARVFLIKKVVKVRPIHELSKGRKGRLLQKLGLPKAYYPHFNLIHVFAETHQGSEVMEYSFIVASLTQDCEMVNDIEQLKSSIYSKDFEIVLATEIGKARCRNIAFKKSVGKFVIFADGDVSIDAKILVWIMEWMKHHPHSILCYPHPSTKGFVSTKVMAISRENFLMLNGFDDSFEEAMDEEWGLRARKAGITQHYLPKEWVVDHGRKRTNPFIDNIRRPFYRGKRTGYHPKLTFIYEDKRNPLRTAFKLIQQSKPIKEHFGILNLRHLVVFLSGLVYGSLDNKFKPIFYPKERKMKS